MSAERETILIKRYASRRLYNTALSDYVTLEQVAGYIRDGKDVKIIDRKTGDDLTRQYLLQIITDYEARGEHILPINVLMDIVRSYSDQAQQFIPDFLSQSFDMIKHQQKEALKTLQNKIPGTITPLPIPIGGLEKWQEMQSDFLHKMMGAWTGDEENDEESGDAGKESTPHPDEALREKTKPATAKTQTAKKSKNHKDQPGKSPTKDDEIAALKKQLASLQTKLDEL